MLTAGAGRKTVKQYFTKSFLLYARSRKTFSLGRLLLRLLPAWNCARASAI